MSGVGDEADLTAIAEVKASIDGRLILDRQLVA
jgi:hypothetical protein